MGLGVHLDPTKIPTRVLFIQDGLESINTKSTAELMVLDDTQGEAIDALYKQIVELRSKGIPEIYILFDKDKFREADDGEKAQIDADIKAKLEAEETAKVAQLDDLFIDQKPEDVGLIKAYGLIDGLADIDGIKMFLKRLLSFTIKRTGNTP